MQMCKISVFWRFLCRFWTIFIDNDARSNWNYIKSLRRWATKWRPINKIIKSRHVIGCLDAKLLWEI